MKGCSGQKITPYLKEKLVYIGQLDSYEKGSEIAMILLNLEINSTAIYRLTNSIGYQCQKIVDDVNIRAEIKLDDEEMLYVESDGSMLLTREKGWSEVKLGRIFSSKNIYEETDKRNWIKDSEYIANTGNHEDFENEMSKILDDIYKRSANQIIFLSDGARWQWNWADAEYPKAIQILDYMHAVENIGKYISTVLPSKDVEKTMKEICRKLKKCELKATIKFLKNIPRSTEKKEVEFNKLMTYIENNKGRMNYKEYIKKGYLIGSGAIESAHRTVLQKRMKQAGQRWSKEGLKNMINIKVLKMSGYWSNITDLIKNTA